MVSTLAEFLGWGITYLLCPYCPGPRTQRPVPGRKPRVEITELAAAPLRPVPGRGGPWSPGRAAHGHLVAPGFGRGRGTVADVMLSSPGRGAQAQSPGPGSRRNHTALGPPGRPRPAQLALDPISPDLRSPGTTRPTGPIIHSSTTRLPSLDLDPPFSAICWPAPMPLIPVAVPVKLE